MAALQGHGQVVIGLLVGVRPIGLALLAGGLAGAIGGALVGGLYSVATRLPVNEDAYETLLIDRQGDDVLVEVRVPDPAASDLIAATMRSCNARAVERAAA